MKNIIEVCALNTQDSLITVYTKNSSSNHIVPNNGWLPLSYWVNYFENYKK